MSRTQRLVLLGLAVAVLAVAGIILGTGGKDDTKSSGPVTITVKGAKPVGGIQDVTFENHKQTLANVTVQP